MSGDLEISDVLCLFIVFLVPSWHVLIPRRIRAETHRVLIRSWFTSKTRLQEGTFWLWFPEYIVHDKSNFGPWAGLSSLPAKNQIREIDVPEILVPVDSGTYTLKVNTKVIGRVADYNVQDLILSPMPITDHMNNVIMSALRSALYDKPLETALTEIQEIFSKDLHSQLKDLDTPTFHPIKLMVDANKSVGAANKVTENAMELISQRKQEVARRTLQAEAHVTAMRELENQLALKTEEQRGAHIAAVRELENQCALKIEEQKVHALKLQMLRAELMMQKEAYGMEGAAQIETAKNAKAIYMLSGQNGSNVWTSLPIS